MTEDCPPQITAETKLQIIALGDQYDDDEIRGRDLAALLNAVTESPGRAIEVVMAATAMLWALAESAYPGGWQAYAADCRGPYVRELAS